MPRLRIPEGSPVQAVLPAWLARAKQCPTTITGTLKSQTDKAIQLTVGASALWLPLSQVKIILDKPTVSVVASKDGLIALRVTQDHGAALARTFAGEMRGEFFVPASQTAATMRTIVAAIEHQAEYAVTISAPAEQRLRELEAAEVGAVKSGDVPLVPKTRTQPWAHQARAWQLAQNLEGVGLFLDMGTGKSKVVVDTVCNGPFQHTLIVCPLTVISVWPRQFATHGGEPVECIPLKGSVEQKKRLAEQALRLPGKVALVINYESLWREPFSTWALAQRWDLVVLDESHKIKAVSGKAAVYCGKLGKHAMKRMCLTGTPMPHSPLDIWSQYRFMAPDVFGGSYVKFRNAYARMGGYGGYQIMGWNDLEQLTDRVYSVAYRVTKDEVLDLPEAIHTDRRFTLDSASQAAYHEMREYLATAVQSGEVTAKNALVKLLRLQQITSGFVTLDTGVPSDGDVSGVRQAAMPINGEMEAPSAEDGVMPSALPGTGAGATYDVPGGGVREDSRGAGAVQHAHPAPTAEGGGGASASDQGGTRGGVDDGIRVQGAPREGGGDQRPSGGDGANDRATPTAQRDSASQERGSAGQSRREPGAMGEGAPSGAAGGRPDSVGGGPVPRPTPCSARDSRIAVVSTAKQDALAEVLDEIAPDEPVVVFARFAHDLRSIETAAEQAGRRYYEISGARKELAAWQDATGGGVVGVQIQAGGVGIDLTRARYCVYYSIGYSLGDYDQSLARVHRPGQTRPVVYVHLLAEGTIDEEVMAALSQRRDLIEYVLTALKTTVYGERDGAPS